MNGLTRLAKTSTVDEVVATLEQDGGIIIEGFLTQGVLEKIKSDLMRLLDPKPSGDDKFTGFQTRRMSALFAYSRRMADIATHPLFLPVAERIIDKPVVY